MLLELRHLISMLVAVVLGFAIGYERKLRYKEAGIRTHTVVCAGSALMMIVSKYGFGDSLEADASRVAAQIVAGGGRLGDGGRRHGGGRGAVHHCIGRNAYTHRRAVPFSYQMQVFSDEEILSDKDLLCERRFGKRSYQGIVPNGPILSPGDRTQGRRDHLSCDIEYRQRVFLAAFG